MQGSTSPQEYAQTFKHDIVTEHPHTRYNPLTGEWVLVSPHRTKRPWQGKTNTVAESDASTPDAKSMAAQPANPLMPGASRPNGKVTLWSPQGPQTPVRVLQ